MGFFFPDPPKQQPTPPLPNQGQVAPVPPEAAPWFTLDQAVHGMADATAEALRRRQMTGGDGPPPTPPGQHSGR